MNSSFSVFSILSVVATVFAQTGPEVASYFRAHLSKASAVYLPTESNYTLDTTQRWNAFSAPIYIVSVKPTTDLDVKKIVRLFDSSKNQSGHYRLHAADSLGNRSNMLIITTYLFSAQVVGTATQQLWVLSRTGLKSTLAISTPSPSTKVPTP